LIVTERCRLQLQLLIYIIKLLVFSGENVEEAFLETAKKIYQNIQDGRLVHLFCMETGMFTAMYPRCRTDGFCFDLFLVVVLEIFSGLSFL